MTAPNTVFPNFKRSRILRVDSKKCFTGFSKYNFGISLCGIVLKSKTNLERCAEIHECLNVAKVGRSFPSNTIDNLQTSFLQQLHKARFTLCCPSQEAVAQTPLILGREVKGEVHFQQSQTLGAKNYQKMLPCKHFGGLSPLDFGY